MPSEMYFWFLLEILLFVAISFIFRLRELRGLSALKGVLPMLLLLYVLAYGSSALVPVLLFFPFAFISLFAAIPSALLFRLAQLQNRKQVKVFFSNLGSD
jgi:hypothetical protein